MKDLNKTINLNKKFIIVLVLVNILIVSFYYSYALFEYRVIKNGVVVLQTEQFNLTYSTNKTNNTLTIGAGQTDSITIILTGDSEERGYKLWYTSSNKPNIEVTTSESYITTNYTVKGTFTSGKQITLTIKNTGNSSVTLTIGANFGWKEYEVLLEDGQNEIKLVIPKAVDHLKKIETSLVNGADAYRYVGASPRNYVWFNCSSLENQTKDTCEKWRIVGIYGDELKIVKDTPSILSQAWGNSNNTWTESSIQTYLNDTYWETMTASAQGMVDQSAIWYIGSTVNTATASEAFDSAKASIWTPHKIGLLASYEYLYAADGINCQTLAGGGSNSSDFRISCTASDWLWPVLTNNKTIDSWLINPSLGNANKVLSVSGTNGDINNSTVTNSLGASPAVYLNSKVIITGGSGEDTNPYVLGTS